MTEIQARLFAMRDEKYSEFQAKLIPTVASGSMIGVRTPQLRALAKEFVKSGDMTAFLGELPHKYFDENQLHAFIISQTRDFDDCIGQVEKFLPYIDNWATCDQLSPVCFKKNAEKLLAHVEKWLGSDHAYTVRFGIGMLMQHFLDGRFDARFLHRVAEIESDDYYIQMMQAWYFATALAKQYDAALPFITERRLSVWVHNKAIQKAIESLRITDEQKALLRTLKIKK